MLLQPWLKEPQLSLSLVGHVNNPHDPSFSGMSNAATTGSWILLSLRKSSEAREKNVTEKEALRWWWAKLSWWNQIWTETLEGWRLQKCETICQRKLAQKAMLESNSIAQACCSLHQNTTCSTFQKLSCSILCFPWQVSVMLGWSFFTVLLFLSFGMKTLSLEVHEPLMIKTWMLWLEYGRFPKLID